MARIHKNMLFSSFYLWKVHFSLTFTYVHYIFLYHIIRLQASDWVTPQHYISGIRWLTSGVLWHPQIRWQAKREQLFGFQYFIVHMLNKKNISQHCYEIAVVCFNLKFYYWILKCKTWRVQFQWLSHKRGQNSELSMGLDAARYYLSKSVRNSTKQQVWTT
jgi:hypothetical protein